MIKMCENNEEKVGDSIASQMLDWRKFKQEKREKEREAIRRREESQPFPTGCYERLQSTQMWSMVLERMEDSLDVSNVSRACPHFGDLLHGRMLTEVFKILRDNHFIHIRYVNFRKSNLQNILQLRLVCKTWKEVVENVYLDSFQGDWKLNFLEASIFSLGARRGARPPTTKKYFFTFKFNLDKVEQSRHNLLSPNLMRMVYVKDADRSEFWFPNSTKNKYNPSKQEETLSLLRTHGHLVRGLCFIASPSDSSVGKYRRLLSLLNEMKNVNALVLLMNTKPFEDDENDSEELCKYLLDFPLPVMPFVEFLQFESKVENHSLVMDILGKCPNLKSLLLPRSQIICEQLACILNKLDVQHYKIHLTEEIQTGQEELLGGVPWSLKTLILKPYPGSMVERDLFLLINRFKDHLENLDLNWYVTPNCRRNPLQLPRLKRLRVSCAIMEEPIDYILPLKSLEHLEIANLLGPLSEGVSDQPNVVIDFVGYAHKLEMSNIWKLFPTLKTVTIQNVRDFDTRVDTTFQYIRRGNDVRKTSFVLKTGCEFMWSWAVLPSLSCSHRIISNEL